MDIKTFINKLGYLPNDGENGIYQKTYFELTIKVDLNSNNVFYPEENAFTVVRKTSSNLNNTENLSVLECIDCLLLNGYKAEDITIERSFTSGTSEVYLDISVQYPKNYPDQELQSKTYMMIEVKQFSEYEKTLKESIQIKNKKPKSQLLSYFSNDRHADFIVYYTNKIDSGIQRKYSFIKTEELKNEKSALDIYNKWNKTYHTDKGIFEHNIPAYQNQIQDLVKENLEDIDSNEDSGVIFHQFLTILRRYSISDKSNAFNKIFNLFICKIKDEDSHQNPKDLLDFQWLHNDNYISLLNRLNTLYKNGIDEYLSIKVCDTTEDEFDKILKQSNVGDSSSIKEVYNQLRLYKNNDFAFIEVFNKETFEVNAKIVKEMVELLQGFKLKYNQKQQFMGDFFEHLLNTGLKQENGQFFTPIPVARFIVNSLPIAEIIHNKIINSPRRLKSDEYSILPYCIDYAAGSGHFLTEIMDSINSIVYEIKESKKYDNNPNIRKTLTSYTNPDKLYNWAPEYIYGIEKDYRLAKTAKICCFLNGDGDANMIYGDGLDDFSNSKHYVGKLKEKTNGKENNQFDIVVANPPYSVANFKSNIDSADGENRFELYNHLGDDSDDIECLFIERTAQLLKQDGFAGVVLPASILNNNISIYNKTREYILKNFHIKAIVDMTSKGSVFAKTGTNAVILFLQRKDSNFKNITRFVEQVFNSKQDVAINGISNLPSIFTTNIHNLKINEYFDILSGKHFKSKGKKDIMDVFSSYQKIEKYREKTLISKFGKSKSKVKFNNFKFEDYLKKHFIVENDIFSYYFEKYSELVQSNQRKTPFSISEYINGIIEKEVERMSYFALTYNQKTMIVKVPNEKDKLEEFLGYSFSERNGEEGIKVAKINDIFQSTLYDETDLNNSDKLNFYIKSHLNNEQIVSISNNVSEFISIVNLWSIVDLDKGNWIKELYTNKKSNILFETTKHSYGKFNTLFTIKTGKSSYTKDYVNKNLGDYPLLTGELVFTKEKYSKVMEQSSEDIVEQDTISVNKDNAAGSRCFYRDFPYVMNSHHLALVPITNNNLNLKYAQILFDNYLKNNHFGWDGAVLGSDEILGLKLPMPSMQIQNKIVDEVKNIEKTIFSNRDKVSKIYEEIEDLYNFMHTNGVVHKISKCCSSIHIGGTPSRKETKYYLNGNHSWVSISDISKNIGSYITETKENVTDLAVKETILSDKLTLKGMVLFSFKLTIGKVCIAGKDLYTNEAIASFQPNLNILSSEYLYYALKNTNNDFSPTNSKAFGKSLNSDSINDMEVKVLPNKVDQNNVVIKLNGFYEQIQILESDIVKLEDYTMIIKNNIT